MWFSNPWNNFAPFAGYMLRGYEFQAGQNLLVEETTKPSQREAPP
jgi:hypothetical protein